MTHKTVHEGFRLPNADPITRNERAWIELLRDISEGRDPAPSLNGIQALRQAFAQGFLPGDG